MVQRKASNRSTDHKQPPPAGASSAEPEASRLRASGEQARPYVAVDVGGTKILAALAEESGVIRERAKTPTPRDCTCRDVLEALTDAIGAVLEDGNVDPGELEAIGVAVPGVVDPKRGQVLVSPNLPIDDAKIAAHISGAFGAGLPVAVGNDGNLAALGESWLGAARGTRSAVAVFVGTGIGGGHVRKGKVLRGAHNGALEVGHMTVQLPRPKQQSKGAGKGEKAPLDVPVCGCGNRGCLEALASRTAMERDIREAIVSGRRSVLPELLGGDLSVIKSGALNQALRREDPVVREVLQRAGEALGYGCMSIAHLLDPEVIVLGGGVIEACGWFLLPIIEGVLAEDGLAVSAPEKGGEAGFRAGRPVPRVRLAALGDDAVVLGALAAARMRVKRSPFKKKYAVLPKYPRVELLRDGFRVGDRTRDVDITVCGNGKLKKAKIRDSSLAADGACSITAKVVRKACKGAPEVLFVGVGPDAKLARPSGKTPEKGRGGPLTNAAREFCEARAIELRVLSVAEAVAAYNECTRRKAAILSRPK